MIHQLVFYSPILQSFYIKTTAALNRGSYVQLYGLQERSVQKVRSPELTNIPTAFQCVNAAQYLNTFFIISSCGVLLIEPQPCVMKRVHFDTNVTQVRANA